MNILDDQKINDCSESMKCKIGYLASENEIMKNQYDFICDLIGEYKKVVELCFRKSKEEEGRLEGEIAQRYEVINSKLVQQIESYRAQDMESSLSSQLTSSSEYSQIIDSYKHKVELLQKEIKHRQKQLQVIEVKKMNPQFEPDQENDKSVSRCINYYDIHAKMLEKVKKEVLKMRERKRLLEDQLIELRIADNQQKTLEDVTDVTCSIQNHFKKLKQIEEHTICQKDNTQTSTFQKLVMIYRKKKYENDNLTQKNKKRQKKYVEKQAINNQLRKAIQEMEWKCVQNIEHARNGFFESPKANDLSIMDGSFKGDCSLSLDVSQFVVGKPKEYSQDRVIKK